MKINEVVSIIVPVYNAKKYIRTCIRSIVAQSYHRIEIILVNDGSSDNSGDICDLYSLLDKRITVIHQQNRGPSAARNVGLAHATGTYIQFVDADDTIKPFMTEKLIAQMDEKTDLVICGYETNGQKFIPEMEGAFEKKQFLMQIGTLYEDIILPSPCNKMYRTKLIKTNNNRFSQKHALGEDLLFNLSYITNCRFVYLSKEILYTYHLNDASLTQAFIPSMYEKQQEIHHHVRQFLTDNNCRTKENMEKIETIIANGIIHATTNLFHRYNPFSKTERKKQLKKIMNDDFTVRQLPYFTHNLQAKLFRYFVKRSAYRRAYLFFRYKTLLQQNVPTLFRLLQRVNK